MNHRGATARERALETLKSPDFFGKLRVAVRKAGLVGEERNALTTYLVGTSRLLDGPLNLLIKGPSSAGKNFLAQAVLGLFPQSETRALTSSSNRSWNYLDRKLKHKVIYVEERNKTMGPVHPARLLISEGELVHFVTVRREGKFVTERRVTKGPIACISTTTKDRVEIDDETRHISIWMDESTEQTKRIARAALEKRKGLTPEEVVVWHEVQRLFRKRAPLPIEFPEWFETVAEQVNADDVRVRRYFPAFLQACRTVCLIRSFRRSAEELRRPGKLRVSFVDFAVTTLILNTVFAESLEQAEKEDVETREHLEHISAKKGGKLVQAVDLARHLGISADRAYGLLRAAVQAGTVRRVNPPERTNRKLYLPARSGGFLPDPEELFAKLDGVPNRVRFVHPLTGRLITYRKNGMC